MTKLLQIAALSVAAVLALLGAGAAVDSIFRAHMILIFAVCVAAAFLLIGRAEPAEG